MIFAAVTGPIPGSASSSDVVARFRSTGRRGDAGGRAAAAGLAATGRPQAGLAWALARIVPRWDDDPVAVLQSLGQVQGGRRPRRVDSRAVATGRGDRIGHALAGGQVVQPRPGNGPGHLDDDLGVRGSGRVGRG